MSGFVVHNGQAGTAQSLTSTAKTITRILCPATLMRRLRVFEIEVSAIGVPSASDGQIIADFTFCDATGAGTPNATATPEPQDHGTAIGTPIDIAVSTGPVNYSAEPTNYTVAHSWWERGFNQRSGVLWQAQPGREIISPGVASAGPGLRAFGNTYTNTVAGTLRFDEL